MDGQVCDSTHTRAGRARLTLSDRAARSSDYARALVSLDSDAFVREGELLACARELRILDLLLMDAAVVYERARGTSWQRIAEILDLDADMLADRYSDQDLTSMDAAEAEALVVRLRDWLSPTRPAGPPAPRGAPSDRPRPV